MRILQIVSAPQRRGAEVFAFQLGAWLRSRGHVLKTVYLHDGEGLPLTGDDEVLFLNERSSFEKVPGFHPAGLLRLRRAVAGFGPDIIQLNGARTVKYGAWLSIICRRASWRLVYRNIGVPSFWLRGFLRRGYYKTIVMPRVDGIVALTQENLDEVRRFYGLDCPSVTIPNAVDTGLLVVSRGRDEIRDDLTTPDDAQVVVFVGALSREKRPDRFLDVMDAVPGISGWFVGDGPMRASLEARVNGSFNLVGRVRFLGRLSAIADVVSAADLLLCPSDSEGIPGAVLEAAWLQLPTVAFATGGLPSCIEHGVTGMLCTPGDSGAIAGAVRELMQDSTLRHKMGASAHARVDERFSMDAVGPQYERFFEGILSMKSGAVSL